MSSSYKIKLKTYLLNRFLVVLHGFGPAETLQNLHRNQFCLRLVYLLVVVDLPHHSLNVAQQLLVVVHYLPVSEASLFYFFKQLVASQLFCIFVPVLKTYDYTRAYQL